MVEKIIQETLAADEKTIHVLKLSETPSLSSFNLDALFDLDKAVELAQSRTGEALNISPEINVSFKKTYEVLEQYLGSKVNLVVLHIDLVGSTKLSMDLLPDKLAAIIQTFTHEMSLIIDAYGGYVLKYVGDAILAFFLVPGNSEFSVPCTHAIACGQSMIHVIKNGINPILNQFGYPELNCRIGIDVGENVVVQFGYDIYSKKGQAGSEDADNQIIKIPHLDILGSTINIATKMTPLAQPGQIIIGELVYNVVGDLHKKYFRLFHVSPIIWNYVSDNTGGIYRLYTSLFTLTGEIYSIG